MFSIKILDFNDKKLLTNGRNCDIIIPVVKRGCSSMAESQPSKLVVWVRFPSPAPKIPNASAFGIFTSSLFTRPRIRDFWQVISNNEK